MIPDTREKLFFLTLDLWKAFLNRFIPPYQRAVEDFIRTLNEDAFPELITKACDANPRIRQAAIEFILWISKLHPSFGSTIYSLLIKPPKNPAISRLFRAKIELIRTFLPSFQLSDIDNYTEQILLLGIMATENNHIEVREAGTTLLKQVCEMHGPRITRFTSKMKSPLIEVNI
jgi:hypothetical protein